jgi:hypothetical protein
MKWGRFVARMERNRNSYSVVVGKPERKRTFEDVGIDGRIKLKIKYTWRAWTLLMYSKMGTVNFSEHDSKSSVSIKCWQFIDMLKNYKLLKNVCIP